MNKITTQTPSGAKINQVNVFQKNGIDLRQVNKKPYWLMAIESLPFWDFGVSDKVKSLRTQSLSLVPVIQDLNNNWLKLYSGELKDTQTEKRRLEFVSKIQRFEERGG
jgi:hypothetical protein